tara:strand:+ start:94 stop:600 length:507 start_codon:yes stop_codon:yes gene_type:complete
VKKSTLVKIINEEIDKITQENFISRIFKKTVKNKVNKTPTKSKTINVQATSKNLTFDLKKAKFALSDQMTKGNSQYIKDILGRLRDRIKLINSVDPAQVAKQNFAKLTVTDKSTYASKINKYKDRGVTMNSVDLNKANLFFKNAFSNNALITTKQIDELLNYAKLISR